MVSSGVKNLGKLIGGWAIAIGLVSVSIVYFEEIRSTLGLKLNPEDLGFSTAAEPQQREPEVREVIRYVERPEADVAGGKRVGQRKSNGGERELFTQQVRLRGDGRGHFQANAQINGRTIDVLVDTGATLVALTYEDAQAAGVAPRADEYRYISQTANGEARFARVRLDEVRIGSISVRNVDAAVSQPGRLNTTLLGMSFLRNVRFESQGGVLTLEQ